METRQLGKDGPQVSVLGFGAWPIGGAMGTVDRQTAVRTIHAAIDHGITLIDTAQSYRASESILGEALKGRRDDVFLATKVSGKYGRDDIDHAMANSLQQLDVDYVDLYQVHSWKVQYPIEETMAAMDALRTSGRTRYIGVSNFDASQMQLALSLAPVQSSQPQYNMFDRWIENEDIPFCRDNGIGILAHSPLAKGLLAGRYTLEHRFPWTDERSSMRAFNGETFRQYLALVDQLKVIAADKGLTMVQLAIAWILHEPTVSSVLIGAKNVHQIEEAVGAVGVRFSEGELDSIESILAQRPAGRTYDM